MTEAIDLLDARARRRLTQLAEHRQTLRRRGPSSPEGQWRRGDAPTERPPHLPRPAAEREIVRRKSFTTAEATVDEAIFDMEALDHDFFLFTDLASGQDAVVHARDDGTYGLQYARGVDEDPTEPTAAAVEVQPDPAPRFTVDQAREHLDLSGAPWLFFVDADHDRGRVLYRRDDGHYGLIAPAG
ncbi:sigma 54 modulation/S30EA ribosomal C-terminal domain-containing protein [Acidimicrobiia bacterium EGI L10123]|nr:sigma 54 modulation/S30EA ribosomal C-terminal domain-containing protein [Acidimicrobiia bacterium EGI L10123]